MNPGRELDALVAEKVMGKTVHPEGSGPIPLSLRLPPYSTDIAAAWLAADKVGLFTTEMFVLAYREHWIVCEEVNPAGPQWLVARGDTAPHAICLAALKAVGVTV